MSIKIKLPKQTDIISMPSDPAILHDITKDGFYVYKIKYLFDPTHWVFVKNGKNKHMPSTVVLNVLSTEQVASVSKIFDRKIKPEDIEKDWAKEITQHDSKQKELTRQLENSILLSYKSDFTKKIPNNLTKEITKANNLTDNKKIVLTKKMSSKTVAVSELHKEKVHPKLDVNRDVDLRAVKLGINPTLFDDRKIMKIKKQLLYHGGFDPAAVFGARSHSVISLGRAVSGTLMTKKSFGKLVNSSNITAKNSQKTIVKAASLSHLNKIKHAAHKLKSLQNIVAKSHGHTTNNDLKSTTDLSTTKSTPIYIMEESHLLEIVEMLYIPIDLITVKDFRLKFEVRSAKGALFQKEEVIVKHEDNVANKLVPALAPDIKISSINKPGKFLIELTQNDENAQSIHLYRRVIPLDEAITNARYTFVKTVSLEKGEHPIIVEDNFASINPIIYRAISASSNGSLGGEFASLVLNQTRSKMAQKSSLVRRPSFVCLTTKIVNNRIELNVSNIPSEPIALKIQRRDLTIHEKEFTNVTDMILLHDGKENDMTVYDNFVKDGRIYEYSVKLLYEDGFEVVANNNVIVEYINLLTNVVHLQTSAPVITTRDKDLDVQFAITKEVVLTNTDYIKAMLREQGLSDEFQADITENKDKLQDLFFVRIVRTNLETGEQEDFGVIDSNMFSDNKFGSVKSVKPLESGIKYLYSIYAHARATNTLLSNMETTVTTRGLTSTYKPSKWKHPVTLKSGNIVTENSIKANYGKSEFTLGNVVDIKYVELDLTQTKPVVTTVKTHNLGPNFNLIDWTISGNANKIDHFIITLDMSGNKTIVGKCHNTTQSNSFQFVDLLDNLEVGSMKYGITPVYYDYSTGQEVFADEILI